MIPEVPCPSCSAPLPWERWNGAMEQPCPWCDTKVLVAAYPALLRTESAVRASAAVPGESPCYYHAGKTATQVCDGCGRFLCALCDIEFGNRHLCPSCLENGPSRKDFTELESQRTLYDNLALTLAVLPAFLCYFSLLTAPVALFVAFRYWKVPGSLLPRTKARFVAAMILGFAELLGWGGLILFVVLQALRASHG